MPINGERHVDCPGLVIVGGIHGVGKTTLVGAITDSEGYVRMPALSTRAKRSESDTEYTPATRAGLEDMLAKGLLLNLDAVNSEHYAVTRADLDTLHEDGQTAVKEIHPDNFHKFEDYCSGTFPVVLVNEPFVSRANRAISPGDESLRDCFHASRLGKMVLALTDFTSVEDAAAHVIHGHKLELKYRGQFPDPRRIDGDNQATYSAMAPVFVDTLRLTTRDFHEASVESLARILAGVPTGSNVLEIGTGTNWLQGAMDLTRFNMTYQESSEAMHNSHSDNSNSILTPIRRLPLRSGSIDYIVGSLVDGMIYPQALLEMQRVLRDQGRIILTYPSRQWTELSRRGERFANFLDRGTLWQAHSFSPTHEELDTLLRDAGYHLEEFIECPPAQREESYYSPALFDANGDLASSIVSIIIARKSAVNG